MSFGYPLPRGGTHSNAVALCNSMCIGRDPVPGVATLPTSWIVELLGQSPQECCSIELNMCSNRAVAVCMAVESFFRNWSLQALETQSTAMRMVVMKSTTMCAYGCQVSGGLQVADKGCELGHRWSRLQQVLTSIARERHQKVLQRSWTLSGRLLVQISLADFLHDIPTYQCHCDKEVRMGSALVSAWMGS